MALRGDSLLVRLFEPEFATGLAAHAAKADPAEVVMEKVELLVFRRP
jgi:hypothetical protein